MRFRPDILRKVVLKSKVQGFFCVHLIPSWDSDGKRPASWISWIGCNMSASVNHRWTAVRSWPCQSDSGTPIRSGLRNFWAHYKNRFWALPTCSPQLRMQMMPTSKQKMCLPPAFSGPPKRWGLTHRKNCDSQSYSCGLYKLSKWYYFSWN